MKKFPCTAIFFALAVFSVPASGNTEDPQISRTGGMDNPPPIDLLITQDVETATFALG